jgi:drug/metabolite transporter (DMT)-like permease
MDRPQRLATYALTALTMIAFAANSVLCRMALAEAGAEAAIDPGSFTAIRLLSGAIVLFPLAWAIRGKQRIKTHASALSALALLGYALAFSWAYVSLDAGVGALILFGAVQTTMVGWGLWSGERPHWGEWLGLLLAVGGLIYLTAPGANRDTPPLLGSLLMAGAGIGWGIYSLRGRGSPSPTLATAGNFVLAAPLAAVALLFTIANAHLSALGVVLAMISGGLTSGLGYALWYRALRGHTATSGAVVQLSVPVIAAFGGVVLLDETITSPLVISGGLVMVGVALAMIVRAPRAAAPRREA